MSDETKKENSIPAEDSQKQTPELSNDEMNKVVGGAFNAYVNFGDIPGESQETNHKDWIEVLSYTHAVTQPKS
jgi:desulfoferrodoxin (superoxide reductase-like protein)